MNLSRLKLRHLQCLAVVGQERNLVRAARALALTQPAVSKTMAELEDIVGRRLLMRRRRGVELTAAGETLTRHAADTLRALHEGLALALEQPEADELRVAVGALPNMAAGPLPGAVARLAASAPTLRVRVLSGTNRQLMTQLRQGEIDLVLGRLAAPATMADLSFRALGSEPLVMVAAPGHPLLTRAVPPTLEDLGEFVLIVPVQGTPVRDTADAFLYARGTQPPPRLVEATDTSFIIGLLRSIDAVWFAPEGAVLSSLARGELQRLPFDTRSTDGPVGVTMRRTGEPGDGARRLLAAIEAELAARAADYSGLMSARHATAEPEARARGSSTR